jgi:hypothetical protein
MKAVRALVLNKGLQIAGTAVLAAVVLDTGLAGAGLGNQAQGAEAAPYQMDATILEIMASIVMPSADILWNSVVAYATKDGLVEEVPETDEDWEKLRWSAVNLAEATNLIMMPGRQVDHPGVASDAPGVELGPDQIQALINDNRPAWNAHAQVLHNTALQTIRIIDERNVEGLSEIGGAIDEACESCHTQFWYPDQQAAL